MDELKKRQLFIIDDSIGKPVATANAWWTEVNGKKAASVMKGKMRDDKYRQFMGIAE